MNLKNEKEFDSLFWEYKDMVYYTALRYLKRPEDAEEIVQETFLKVYLHFSRFRKESSAKTWIYRIGLNEIFTRFRKERRNHQFRVEFSDLEAVRQESEELFRLHLKKDFLELIRKLPKKRGRVMFLRVLENLSFKEIGDILEISENSAKSIYSLGLKEIQKKTKGGRR